MNYNIEWLLNEINQGKPIEFLLFWGHRPSKYGEIGMSCLSQWYEISFIVDNVRYATAEHWMMAEKARICNDLEIMPHILEAPTAEIAKKLGRKIKNFDQNLWDKHKYESVKRGNLHKFSQNARLKKYLISTADKILVEASPYDQIWGIGLGKESPNAVKPECWNGQNLLGFALMVVRDELMNSAGAK